MAAKDAKAQEVARKLEEYIEKYDFVHALSTIVAHEFAILGFITQSDTQTRNTSTDMSSCPSHCSR